VGLLTWVYFNGKAKAEERWLVRRYPAYEAYTRRVPRRVL
jgi:protein-S-isoprenylcysteine O-methyltransferase Ste14